MKRSGLRSLLLALVTITFVAGCTSMNYAYIDEHGIKKVQTPVEEAKVEKYWTEKRMKRAKAYKAPKIRKKQFKQLISKQTRESEVYTIEPSDRAGKYDVKKPRGVNGKATRANVKQRPFWNGGKFYFTKGKKDYYCSAEFVGSDRVVMTAAHCVTDGKGKWYKNFLFRRAYKNGGGQKVGWKCMSVMRNYFQGGDLSYDYAFIYSSKDSGAGWLGFRTGVPYANWWSIGYPNNYNRGRYMYKAHGDKGRVSGGTVEMLKNPMKHGSSGGAWIGDLTIPHVGGNYAIGLNSYYVRSNPNNVFSPYFNSTTYYLLNYVKDRKCMKV